MCHLWYARASYDYLQDKSSASSSRKTIDSRCRRKSNAPTSEWDTASGKLKNEEDLLRRLPTHTQGQVSECNLTAVDAFVGFTGKLRLTELNDCMTIQISYDRLTYRALIDSGCDVNILFHDSTHGLTVPTTPLDGTLRGIGDVRAKISGSVRLSVNVGALKMKESTFYILDGENEQYDCILGSEFLRANGFEIHPKENAVKIRDVDGYTLLSFSTSGELDRQHLCKMNLIADESVTLLKGKNEYIGVTWKGWDPGSGQMLYGTGRRCPLENKGMQVMDGILDGRNPRICLSSGIRKKLRVQAGDVIGEVYSVLEIDAIPEASEGTRERLSEQLISDPLITDPDKRKLIEMLYANRRAISLNEEDLGATQLPSFSIDLIDETPIYQRPRYFPAPIVAEIKQQCEKLEAMNVIEESNSPWNSPIVPIRKPDGSLRICVDYRKVNAVTVKARLPMNVVTDSVYSMHGKKIFTKLDLLRGYYQMPVEESSRPITAFSTAHKHYQFKRLSFGLANAPGAFQKGMNVLLSKFPSANVTVFIDDILIVNENQADHLKLVEEVLKTLILAGVKVKYSKCQWFMKEVEFLGHIVSESGIRKSEEFVEKVRTFPRPRTVRDLRGFLGLVNFQRKFMKDCSAVMSHLTPWTGKKKGTVIKWSVEMDEAFHLLVELAAEDIQLAYPDYSSDAMPLELYTDASQFAMGGCLMQEQRVNENETAKRVIGYVSKAFNRAERRYATIERELAAIRFCFKAFKGFLFGIPFVLKTDHAPLVYLHRMNLGDSRLARTLNDLTGFDFRIEYVPGERNELADLMSRLQVEGFPDEEYADDFLPVGVSLSKVCPGGGNSLFDALFYTLNTLPSLHRPLPDSMHALRMLVMQRVIETPEKWNITTAEDKRLLRRLMTPGTPVFQGVLSVVSDLFKVTIHVFFGLPTPLTYRGKNVVVNSPQIALQCLGGVHYNSVVMSEDYIRSGRIQNTEVKKVRLPVDENEMIDTIEDIDGLPDMSVLKVQKVEYCTHQTNELTTARVRIAGDYYCVTWDTGSQISLVTRRVVDKLDRLGLIREQRPIIARLTGIGEGIVKCGTEVRITARIGKDIEIEHSFIVIEDQDLDYCFLLGIDFMRANDISIDFSRELVGINGSYDDGLVLGDTIAINMVGLIRLCPEGSECLTDSDFYRMQKSCDLLKRVKDVLSSKTPISKWPQELTAYKRYANRLYISNGIVWISPISMEGEFYEIPLVSYPQMVGLLLILHFRWAHIGKRKLLNLAQDCFFHPETIRVASEITRTCIHCQKSKVGCGVSKPPIIKVNVSEPFEMLAIDCVSYPRSSRGNVALLVAVDHKSKFLYATPLRKKTSQSISNAMTDVILPMCVKKPSRVLSDNGPEFRGESFTDMLAGHGIKHVTITSYVSQANGLVERTIKTITQLIRLCTDSAADWDQYIPKVLWIYNSTIHRALGMSPQSYLLSWKTMTAEGNEMNDRRRPDSDYRDLPGPGMTCRDPDGENSGWQEFWRLGSKDFKAFETGNLVLKRILRIGRRVEHKFLPIFEGPYQIKNVYSHGLSYLLTRIEDGHNVRGHYSQLKRYHEPPPYLVNHPVYQMVHEKEQVEITPSSGMDFLRLEGRELVLVDLEVKKKRKRGRTSGKKKKLRLLAESDENSCMEDSESEDKVTETRKSFEGSPESKGSQFRLAANSNIRLLDSQIDSPLIESKRKRTRFAESECTQYSEITKRAGVSFRSLTDRERITTSSSQNTDQSRDWSRLEQFLFDSVEVGRDRKNQAELSKTTVDRYLARLEELLIEMRESLSETPTLEQFLDELDCVLDDPLSETVEEEEGSIARRPITRSQGRVEEEKWVLGRAFEHCKKGRPRQRRQSF